MRTRISNRECSIRHVQGHGGCRVLRRTACWATLALVPLVQSVAQSAPVVRGAGRIEPDSTRLWVKLEATLNAISTPALRRASITQLKQQASQAAARGDSLGRAEALLFAGVQYYALRRADSAQLLLREARALYHAKGARYEEAQVLEQLADRNVPVGERALADTVRAYFEESRAIFHTLQRPGDEGRVLAVLGHRWVNVDSNAALEFARAGLRLVMSTRDTQSQKVATRRLGDMLAGLKGVTRTDEAYYLPLRDSAAVYFRQTRALAATVRDTTYEAFSLRALLAMYSPGMAQPKLFRADSMNAYVRRLLAMSRRSLAPKQREEVASHRLIARFFGPLTLDSALVHARAALTISRAQADSSNTIITLSLLADLHRQADQPDSTIATLRERALYRDSTLVWRITTLNDIATAYDRSGRDDSSTIYLERVVAKAESLPSMAKSGYQRQAFHHLAYIRMQSGDLDSALTLVNRFASLLSSNDTAGTVNHLLLLGDIQEHRGHPDSAEAINLSALPLATGGVLRASVLRSLATFDLEAGRIESALTRTREAMAIFRQLGHRLSEADELSGLATIYERVGQTDSAFALHERALQIGRVLGDRSRQISDLINIGAAYDRANQGDSAMTYGKRALALASTMDWRLALAGPLGFVGRIFTRLGQRDSARFYIEKAVALNREFGRQLALADALQSLGLVRLYDNIVDDSTTAILREAVALAARVKDARSEANGRVLLSRALKRQMRLDSALAQARMALAMYQRVRIAPGEAHALMVVGSAFVGNKQADSARAYLARSIDLSRRIDYPAMLRNALFEMAELHRAGDQEQLLTAVAYYDSAAMISEGARRRAGDDASVVAIAEYGKEIFDGWALSWAALMRSGDTARSAQAALGAAERGRSQALTDMIRQLASKEQLAAAERAKPKAGSDLAAEIDSLLAPLRRDRQAALSYLLTDSTLIVWLLSPDGSISMTTSRVKADELRLLVRSARRAFGADGPRSAALAPSDLDLVSKSDSIAMLKREPADDLRGLAALLLPEGLESRVPAGTPILIVPSGRISLVPFAALEFRPRAVVAGNASRSSGSGSRALGLRNPLRFAPSFAALRATEARPVILETEKAVGPRSAARATSTSAARSKARTKNGAPIRPPTTARGRQMAQALVVGNPSMPSIYSGRFATRAKLQPLPGALAEARGIASQLGSGMLTGSAASETAVRVRLASAPIVHFATHGMAYGSSSTSRGSYVAFAADKANDGLLTVGELMDDPTLVLNAELVVLSACQTGLGNINWQEGTVGLQRAFLAKGARSVLVSLWNVDDAATRVLMERFYGYWLDEAQPHSKAQALQMAQRDVQAMPRFAHPRFWAGFQLVGAN